MSVAARTSNETTGTGPVFDVAGRTIVTGPDGVPISVSISGGAGDASAANQTSQIAQIGEVQASPTSNTVLDRLKTIATAVAAATPAGNNNIGDVDVATVPTDPFGATADAAVTAGATGSISAKLRSISRDIVANIVLAAGSNTIGKVDLNAGTNAIGTVGVTSQPNVSSATLANVSSSATSVTLKASNGSRKGLLLFNDSTAVLYIKFGATASATSYTVQVAAGGYWEMQPTCIYTGIVDGIWASANGNARVTEL